LNARSLKMFWAVTWPLAARSRKPCAKRSEAAARRIPGSRGEISSRNRV